LGDECDEYCDAAGDHGPDDRHENAEEDRCGSGTVSGMRSTASPISMATASTTATTAVARM
jgi:hypothetical protein